MLGYDRGSHAPEEALFRGPESQAVTALIAIVEFGRLAAAVLGVLCGVRGWWPEVVGCAAVVISCAVVAAVWAPTE